MTAPVHDADWLARMNQAKDDEIARLRTQLADAYKVNAHCRERMNENWDEITRLRNESSRLCQTIADQAHEIERLRPLQTKARDAKRLWDAMVQVQADLTAMTFAVDAAMTNSRDAFEDETAAVPGVCSNCGNPAQPLANGDPMTICSDCIPF